MPKKLTDDEFIAEFRRFGSPADMSKALNLSLRNIYQRRSDLEHKYCIRLDSTQNPQRQRQPLKVPKIGNRAIQDGVRGTVIVGSDLHAWPRERSTAFGAMIALIRQLKPTMVIMNGDIIDGARISRHPPMGESNPPTVKEELEAVKERLAEIEAYAPDDCHLIITLGNHDLRWGARLMSQAPEFAGVDGFQFHDHFPAWEMCQSLWINDNTVVKHQWHQSVHSGYQNALKSGRNIITGHTHRLLATPIGDYNGLRWGIECGMLSDFGPDVEKFHYTLDNPVNWSQGFAVLNFDASGQLLDPEFCRIRNGVASFRSAPVVLS